MYCLLAWLCGSAALQGKSPRVRHIRAELVHPARAEVWPRLREGAGAHDSVAVQNPSCSGEPEFGPSNCLKFGVACGGCVHGGRWRRSVQRDVEEQALISYLLRCQVTACPALPGRLGLGRRLVIVGGEAGGARHAWCNGWVLQSYRSFAVRPPRVQCGTLHVRRCGLVHEQPVCAIGQEEVFVAE